MLLKILFLLLLSANVWAADPPLQLYDEGSKQGVVFNLNCTGAGISCSKSGITGTLNVSTGGGGSQWTTSGSDIYYNSGNVGIGSINPTALLNINSSAAQSLFRVDDNTTDGTPFLIDQNGNVAIGSTTIGYKLLVRNPSGTENLLRIQSDSGTDPTNTIVNDQGYWGIGASPAASTDFYIKATNGTNPLKVDSNSASTTMGSGNVLIGSNANTTDGNYAGIKLGLSNIGSKYTDTRTKSQLDFSTYDGASDITAMTIRDGNVGVGSTAPSKTVDVVGSIRASTDILVGSLSVCRSDGTNCPASGGTPGGSTTNVQYNSAGSFAGSNNFVFNGTNVGINTTILGLDTLTVKGTSAVSAASLPTMSIRSLNVTDDDTTQQRLSFYSRNDQNIVGTVAGQIRGGSNYIEMRPGSTTTSSVVFKEDGNVGIGTITPGAPLAVMNGNVGIGTNYARSLLHLAGSNGANIRLNNTAASGNTYDIRSSIFNYSNSGFEIFNSTANRNELSIDNNGNFGIGTTTPLGALVVTRGNVGIGTATPLHLLSVQAASSGVAMILRDKSDAAGSQGLSILLNSKGNGSVVEDNLVTLSSTGASTGSLALGAGSSEVMRAANTGNVGIGTFNPNTKLHVGAGNASLAAFNTVSFGTGTPGILATNTSGVASIGAVVSDGTNNPRVNLFVDQTNLAWGLKNDFSSFSNSPFIIATGGGATEKMRIDYNGNVGLGTVNPKGRLQVSSETSVPFIIDSNGNVGIGTMTPRSIFQVGPGTGSGNVGIGSVNPTAALDIGSSGNIRIDGLGGSSFDILCRKADKTIGVCATSISGVGCTACN